MKNRFCCNRVRRPRATEQPALLLSVGIAVCILAWVPRAVAGGDAPQWMHALVSAPLPSYDQKQ